jgi:subtilisin-like proprotein convertase family protein
MPAFEQEPNDAPATATPVTSGERIRGSVSPAGDIDVYRFSANAGDRVFTATMADTFGNFGETQLSLVAPDGESVIETDYGDGTFSSSSIAGATIPASGTYYLKVTDPSPGGEVVPYDLYLQLRSGSPVPESEPNTTLKTANSLASGYVSGKQYPPDRDYYAMQLQAGDTVFLSLDLDPERDGKGFNGRLGFGLLGEPGYISGVHNDEPYGVPSDAYEITVLKGGTYYAVVTTAEEKEGGPEATYRLSATVLPAEEPRCRIYTSTPSPGTIPDWGGVAFPISVPDAATISRAAVGLDLTHPRMEDLAIWLRTPSGSEIPLRRRENTLDSHMVTRFDPYAAAWRMGPVNPVIVEPPVGDESNWLNGQQISGTWDLVVRDEEIWETGSVSRIELIFCTPPEPPSLEPQPNPSNEFRIGRVKKGRLKITLASAGTVRVVPRLSRHPTQQALRGRLTRAITPSSATGGPGAVWVPLRLTSQARAQLKTGRTLRFKALATFMPTGGDPSTKSATLAIRGR